jgi:hypothetical protein
MPKMAVKRRKIKKRNNFTLLSLFLKRYVYKLSIKYGDDR